MGIEKYIPSNDENWVVRHNTLYYRKVGLIPALKFIGGELFICLDQRITNQVIRLIKKISKNGERFFLCDRSTIIEKNIHYEDLNRIIKNYLIAISNQRFFEFIINSEDFDFIKNLTNFLDTYKCYKNFKTIYENLKISHFNRKYIDWFQNREFHEVKNEEIRDYYAILERQMKLTIFFS